MSDNQQVSDFEATLQLASFIGLQASPNHFHITSSNLSTSRRRMALVDWRFILQRSKQKEIKQKNKNSLKYNVAPFQIQTDYHKANPYKRNIESMVQKRKAQTARSTFRRPLSQQKIGQLDKRKRIIQKITSESQQKRSILKQLINQSAEKPSILKRKSKKEKCIKIKFNKKTKRFQFI